MNDAEDVPAAADGHPQLGSVHKNGDRRFGTTGLLASVYASRGTPQASNLYRSSVTEHMRGVRLGDELCVRCNGSHWWAVSPAGTVDLVEEPPGGDRVRPLRPEAVRLQRRDVARAERHDQRRRRGRQLRRIRGARQLRAGGLADDADAVPGGARADHDDRRSCAGWALGGARRTTATPRVVRSAHGTMTMTSREW